MGMGVEVGNGMRRKAGRLAGNKGVKLSVKGCHKGVSKVGLECGGGGCWQSGCKRKGLERRRQMNVPIMVLMMTGYSRRIFNYKGRSYYFLYSVFTRARC